MKEYDIPQTDNGKLWFILDMWNKAMDDPFLTDGEFIDEMDDLIHHIHTVLNNEAKDMINKETR
jgi:hypothetical protein